MLLPVAVHEWDQPALADVAWRNLPYPESAPQNVDEQA
jgi:hypothetical protein